MRVSIRGSSWFSESISVSPFGSVRMTTPIGSPSTAGAIRASAGCWSCVPASFVPAEPQDTTNAANATTSALRNFTMHLMRWTRRAPITRARPSGDGENWRRMDRVYLDNNATTRPLPDVADAVAAAMAVHGNPSSLHATGRAAARLLAESRAAVASWLGARVSEVTFTSGGTEADRLALLGALAAAGTRRHVVSSAIEHSAILALLRARDDVELTVVRPREDGRVDPEEFAAALRDDTALACLMAANSETGVLQPAAEAAAACRARGVPLLVDAVQAAGRGPFDFRALSADLVAVSAHKIHGVKGAGALLVREGARWKAPFPSSHEGGRRAGTEAIPAIAGFAAAAKAAAALTPADHERVP